MDRISLTTKNKINSVPDDLTALFNSSAAESAYSFHKTFPVYAPTPLIELTGLARVSGAGNIFIKDESHRFGLNAFKVLGASYAVAGLLTEKFELSATELSFSLFNNSTIRNKAKEITFVTATDGNHGRGVAWTAMQLGCKAVIYMPSGTSPARYNAIKNLGADVTIINGTHSDAVELAAENAKKFDWILIQDTAWPGYTEIPVNIMRGYLTIWKEFMNQSGGILPTHIFIQCGVGSLPAAILAHTVELYGSNKPKFINVEPDKAACVRDSFIAGREIRIAESMNTIMAGLACDTPSSVAFEILKTHSEYFITCGDEVTIKGMQILGERQFGDPQIISGESGAVAAGLIYYLLNDPANSEIADSLGLDSSSRILLISTEGDTDPDFYSRTVKSKRS